MKDLLLKALPTCVVAAVLGYCCWSEDDPAAASTDKAAKKTEPLAGLLSPSPPPVSERDPFRMPGERPSTGKAARSTPPSRAPRKKPLTGKESLAPRARIVPALDHPLVGSNLVLRGTYLRDDRRLALINDRFRHEGETIYLGKDNEMELVVALIEPDRVYLNSDDETIELKYPVRETRPGTAPKSSRASKTGSGHKGP